MMKIMKPSSFNILQISFLERETEGETETEPFTAKSVSVLPLTKLGKSDMDSRSLNLYEKMARVSFLATAMNLPFTLHSTKIQNKI